MSNYYNEPRNILPNGLTLLQVNPDCAARLDHSSSDYGWLYVRHYRGGPWVTYRKLSQQEIDEAYDQQADMTVLNGTKVRAG